MSLNSFSEVVCVRQSNCLAQGLISHAEVIELELHTGTEGNDESASSPPSSRGHSLSLTSRFSFLTQRSGTGEVASSKDEVTLYERGQPTDTFTLILQGKVLIRTGELVHLLLGAAGSAQWQDQHRALQLYSF